METAVSIKNFVKNYGDVHAVRGINFDIRKGEMFGLVGPDGAGKTSTIRMLVGLINPVSGNAELLGRDLKMEKREIQKITGYLSQKFSLYGDLSIDENIEFFAEIHDIRDYKKRRDELLDFTRLKPFRERLAERLSGGMKQKLALACSLIHRPQILFLDEPTTGVDPVSRRDFWKILSDLKREGITIIMTTPYLDEAERCNRVALMDEGKIIALDEPEKLRRSTGKDVIEIICDDVRKAYKLVNDTTSFDAQMYGDRINVSVDNYEQDFPAVKSILEDNSIVIKNHRKITPSLENIFIHLINEKKKTEKTSE